MRALVAGFALLSLTFLVLAARAWRREGGPAAAPAERSRWRGGLILTAVALGSLAAVWLGADAFGWARDRALWIGFGGLLALAALARPWWFWEDYRAQWLRRLIGDEATALVYLAVAAAMLWVGLFTDWRFGRR